MSGWRRIKPPALLLTTSPDARCWQRDVHDGHLSVFVSTDDDLVHLSISHRTDDLKPGRYPTWDELHDARYRFTPLNRTMAMLLPPQEEYVNVHETTFHLWEVPRETQEPPR